MDGRTDRWMDGWKGGWKDGWMARWMDGKSLCHFHRKNVTQKAGSTVILRHAFT